MTEPITPRRAWIQLAEAVKNWEGGYHPSQEILDAIHILPVIDEEAMHLTDIFNMGLDKEAAAWGVAENLEGKEDFNKERFLAHALSTRPSPRRAWILLAEAIRQLPMDQESVQTLAEATAAHLDGQPKFDGARFIFHATSSSDADDDSVEGKWSYNRLNPDAAMKTTIEPGE